MSGVIGEHIRRAHSTPGATPAIFGGSRDKSLRANRSSAAWSGVCARGTSADPGGISRYRRGPRSRRSPHSCRRKHGMILARPSSLAHDVRSAVMPFAALLNDATAKGLPAHRHAATVSETKKLHVIAVKARGAPLNLNGKGARSTMSKREDVRDDDRDPLGSSAAGAIGDSDRPRPPEVHHAQRRDLGGRGDERLHAIGDRTEAPLRQQPQPHRRPLRPLSRWLPT